MIDFVRISDERLEELEKERKLLKKLEEFSGAKIKFNEEIEIECGDSLMLLRVKEVLHAFGRGFDLKTSMSLLDENFVLETINVGEFAGKSKKRQHVLKGRVIGRQGTIEEYIEKTAEVKLSIYGKTISIIGLWANVNVARQAVEKLLSGAKHSTVYRFFEERLVK